MFCALPVCAQVPNEDSVDNGWAFSISGFYYFVPDDANTYMLIGTADHKRLHLETRYNYEDQNTGSAFVGWRFNQSGKLDFEVIPMAGLIVGNTNGIAPGLELSLAYKKFDYYAESEYVIDFEGGENNFFYVWSELAYSPLEALRTGLIVQRTRLYQSNLDVQAGFFANYSFWKMTAGLYYLNPLTSSNIVVVSMSFEF